MSDQLDWERAQVEREHKCECETCARSTTLCPATTSSIIDELAQQRILVRQLRHNILTGPAPEERRCRATDLRTGARCTLAGHSGYFSHDPAPPWLAALESVVRGVREALQKLDEA